MALEIADLKRIVENNGYLNDEVRYEVKDALQTSNTPERLGIVYTEILQQLIQYQAVGERLIRKMRFSDIGGDSTTYRWIGAGNIPNVIRAEGAEYAEFSLAVGKTSVVKAQFLQCGLVVKITAEDIKYSRWDVISAHITQAGLALARAKEKMIFDTLADQGVIVFDNNDTSPTPSASIKGVCTGRDRYGNKNGSFTQDDALDMVAIAMANGYNPNVMLIHPLALPIFQKDPLLRHQAFVSGNPTEFYNSSLRSPNPYSNGTVDTWRKQKRAATGKADTLNEKEQTLLSTTQPDLAPFHPLNGLTVVTSHMVPYDPVNKTTSIILIDTNASALLNEQAPLTVDSWEEQSREIYVVRIKEAYSIDVIDEGKGIVVAKNIPLVPNEIFNDPQIVINDLTP